MSIFAKVTCTTFIIAYFLFGCNNSTNDNFVLYYVNDYFLCLDCESSYGGAAGCVNSQIRKMESFWMHFGEVCCCDSVDYEISDKIKKKSV